jgi:hypothetical protein
MGGTAHPADHAADSRALSVNLEAASRVASRWLQMDPTDGAARACIVLDVDAVYVRHDSGWAVLVGNDMRPLVAEPGRSLASLVAEYAAGFRTDRSRGAA